MNRDHSVSIRADVRACVFDSSRRQGMVNVTLIAEEVRARNVGEGLTSAEAERLVMVETIALDVPMVFSREAASVPVNTGPNGAAVPPAAGAQALAD